jgi:hypothetical protein
MDERPDYLGEIGVVAFKLLVVCWLLYALAWSVLKLVALVAGA